jgi:hypothetical protein
MFPFEPPLRQPADGPVAVESGHVVPSHYAAARKRSANLTHNAAPGAISASLKS